MNKILTRILQQFFPFSVKWDMGRKDFHSMLEARKTFFTAQQMTIRVYLDRITDMAS